MSIFSNRRKHDARVNELVALPPFAAFCGDTLRAMASTSCRTSRPAGSQLARQGSYGHEVFVISSGTVDVVRDGQRIETLGPGDLLGEMAMVGDPHRTADAFAREEVELIVWDRGAFLGLLSQLPALDQVVRRTARDRQEEVVSSSINAPFTPRFVQHATA